MGGRTGRVGDYAVLLAAVEHRQDQSRATILHRPVTVLLAADLIPTSEIAPINVVVRFKPGRR